MPFQRAGLLTKFVLYFSALSTITVVLVAVGALLRARDSLFRSTLERLQVEASLKELQLNEWVEDQQSDVLLLSQLQEIREAVETLTDSDGLMAAVDVTITSGREELLDDSDKEAIAELAQHFTNIAAVKPNITTLNITTNGGFIIFSSNDSAPLGSYRALGPPTTFFTQATARNVQPNFYLANDRAAITFATYIYDREQQPMGALAIDLELGEIDRAIGQNTETWNTVETYLVGNSNGRFQLISEGGTPQEQQADLSRAPDWQELNSQEQSAPHPTIPTEPASPGIESAFLFRGSRAGLTRNYDGDPVLGVYQWLPVLNGVLVVEMSQSEAFAPAHQLARDIVAIGLGTIALLLVAVYISSRKLVAPILAIAEAADEMALGHLNRRAPVLSNDEIGFLAKTFNHMSDKLQALISGLEERVQERTQELELSQVEAHQARILAEQANEAKSMFLANMSHELRTPMNAILGYSDMLIEEAEELDPLDFVPDLEKIRTSGQHLLELINGVLDLSKIEAGRMELYLERFNLPTLLTEISHTIEPLASKNHNQLTIDTQPNVGDVNADLTKLRQILLNLLSNACKFTLNGDISLITQQNLRAGTLWIECAVTDSGIGMTQAQIETVFEAFSQADNSTTRKYGGTGLGLAISKQFAELMGGTIELTSVPNIGSTFTLVFPADVASVSLAKSAKLAESDSAIG
ncbi:MAG: ATP-binding protein [Cyanobacteria bacterium P01_E01_bin.34]